MNKSLFWARLLGLYTIILSAWTFFHIKQLPALILDMTNPSTSMILGLFTVFLGLSLMVSHPIWKGWPIIVTVLGYWITIKGIVLLFFPQWINHIVKSWQDKNMIFAPIPALVIGLILLFCGFFLRKTNNGNK